jgi:hypothetical protein
VLVLTQSWSLPTARIALICSNCFSATLV